jgi:hypothetical protein
MEELHARIQMGKQNHVLDLHVELTALVHLQTGGHVQRHVGMERNRVHTISRHNRRVVARLVPIQTGTRKRRRVQTFPRASQQWTVSVTGATGRDVLQDVAEEHKRDNILSIQQPLEVVRRVHIQMDKRKVRRVTRRRVAPQRPLETGTTLVVSYVQDRPTRIHIFTNHAP